MATPILVPPLGQTTDTVVFSTWYKHVGESVKQGETLFAIETDKATLDIEAQVAGILQAVTASAGDEVAVLSTIGVLAAEGEVISSEAASKKSPVLQLATVRGDLAQKVAAPVAVTRETGKSRFFISPRAKRYAEDNLVEWRVLTGTGSQGAVVERDVRAFLAARGQGRITAQALPVGTPSTPPVAGGVVTMISSHVDLTLILEMLARLNGRERTYSVDDIIITMVVRTMQHFPVTDEGGSLVVVGLVKLTHIASTIQVLQVPGTVRMQQVKQARDAVQPMRIAEKPHTGRLDFAYINLDGLHLDNISGMPGIDHAPILQLGRMQKGSDGTVSAQISLGFSQQSTDINRAATLLGNVVRVIEDPDLLF